MIIKYKYKKNNQFLVQISYCLTLGGPLLKTVPVIKKAKYERIVF